MEKMRHAVRLPPCPWYCQRNLLQVQMHKPAGHARCSVQGRACGKQPLGDRKRCADERAHKCKEITGRGVLKKKTTAGALAQRHNKYNFIDILKFIPWAIYGTYNSWHDSNASGTRATEKLNNRKKAGQRSKSSATMAELRILSAQMMVESTRALDDQRARRTTTAQRVR